MPGGVNSPVRAFGGMDIGPLVIARAEGSRIYDIDGNTFIDYVCSWGPMIVGHGHERVIEAIREATEKGTSFGAPTEAETELAEKIISSFRSIDKVRLVNSGTEAAEGGGSLPSAEPQLPGSDRIPGAFDCRTADGNPVVLDAGQ